MLAWLSIQVDESDSEDNSYREQHPAAEPIGSCFHAPDLETIDGEGKLPGNELFVGSADYRWREVECEIALSSNWPSLSV